MPRTWTRVISRASQERQRTTVPSPGMYTASSATALAVPQLPQVATAVVISVPNTSISSPPIAFPSRAVSSIATPASQPAGTKPLGPDPYRRIPQIDQVGRDRFHKAGRPAHIRQRLASAVRRGRGPGHLGQYPLIHPPGVTG